jgi:hypothetical protein
MKKRLAQLVAILTLTAGGVAVASPAHAADAMIGREIFLASDPPRGAFAEVLPTDRRIWLAADTYLWDSHTSRSSMPVSGVHGYDGAAA